MTAGKPSRCQDVPGLISKTIQDAFIYLLHDWPVIVIPVYIYNTTHMDTTHTLYISNLDWEMYTKTLYIKERSYKQFCKGKNTQHKNLSGETARWL